MWFYGRNYRDASKVGKGTVVLKHALLSWYKLPRHKEKHRRRKSRGIRGRITAVLPVLLLLRSWETAGGEKRSSHMWELVRELSQVQRLRVSLAYLSQAQSAVERLFVWLFPRGYPQRGTLQIQTAWACRRERRAGRMVSYEGCVDCVVVFTHWNIHSAAVTFTTKKSALNCVTSPHKQSDHSHTASERICLAQ